MQPARPRTGSRPRQAQLDEPVITELEVQAVELLQTAPVAAVQVPPLVKAQGAGHGLSVPGGEGDHCSVGQGAARQAKELGVEVGAGQGPWPGLQVGSAQLLEELLGRPGGPAKRLCSGC